MDFKFYHDTPKGVIINIKLIPNSRTNKIYKEVIYFNNHGYLKATVTAIASENLANSSLILLLSKFFHLSKSSIIIRKGHKCAYKSVLLANLSSEKILQTLKEVKC